MTKNYATFRTGELGPDFESYWIKNLIANGPLRISPIWWIEGFPDYTQSKTNTPLEVAANFWDFSTILETGVFRILDMKLKEDMSENQRQF